MSADEAKVLIAWGRIWHSHMWIRGNAGERDRLIGHVNEQLNVLNLELGRGWQAYDPVIRRVGSRPKRYQDIASWALRQPNNGVDAARTFLAWATGDTVGLLSLSTELQDFAIITHLAEVGRGYSAALKAELYPWLEDIVEGTASWGDYPKRFAPSLTYSADAARDFVLEPD